MRLRRQGHCDVNFNVNGDLESDVNIYMTMAAVNGEILVSTQSMDLCEVC
jgi:hypothetical protein